VIINVDELRCQLREQQDKLNQHPLYDELTTAEDMRFFMENHVFAVWDFMSLLKSLEYALCPTQIPWRPQPNSIATRILTEIRLGEECDLSMQDADNRTTEYQSHFETYLDAMRESGADCRSIDSLIIQLDQGEPLDSAMRHANVPESAQEFVRSTFRTIQTRDPLQIAASFTFGRENLLPAVFGKIAGRLDQSTTGNFKTLLFYLNRHIELDGDEHGPLSEQFISELCGDNPLSWETVCETAKQSLDERLQFWDSIANQLKMRRNVDIEFGCSI